MTAPPTSRVHELQERVQRMQGVAVSRTLDVLPAFRGLVQLRTGCAYSVDSPSLAMALLAGPSQAGEWAGIVGAPDFGFEAAAAFGVELERTIAVPDPGEHWLSVTARLIDVVSVVLVRPPSPLQLGGVSQGQAARLKSRLRQKDSLLIAWGDWPRCEQRLSIRSSSWRGLGEGYGRLQGRQVDVAVTSASAPPRCVSMWLPDEDQHVRLAEAAVTDLADVRAG
jgi:hypothetical protein